MIQTVNKLLFMASFFCMIYSATTRDIINTIVFAMLSMFIFIDYYFYENANKKRGDKNE